MSREVWAAALTAYEVAQLAAGRSAGTIRLHRHYLERLREACPSPWKVRTPDLQGFLAVEHWSPETRKSARGAVRSFYRWASGSGQLDEDPAAGLEAVRVPAGVPRPTPEHVVRQLLRDTDSRIGFLGMLAALAGMRCAEMAVLNPARDYVGDWSGGSLLVHGKGGKLRDVPIVDDRLAGRLAGAEPGWAFPNGRGSHISPAHVSVLLSRALPVGWTAHQLRHRCATVAYAGTRDLLAVGALLGHTRPETTQRYVKMPDDALQAAARAAAQVA